ncbi:MAG: proline/glycine betaine ABC transporter permease [Clostridia bacterium]|nr:proline/glycine betaine ABC transporter permease [Clostridia bacterium]
MDWLFRFPDTWQIPLADWVQSFVRWLETAGQPVFAPIAAFLRAVTNGVTDALLALPWPILVLAALALAWRARGVRLAAGVASGFLLIGFVGMWELAMRTLALVLVSGVISVALGVPLGVAMAKSRTVSRVVEPILDFMQTMPSFVYLLPALMLFGLGQVPAVIATVVYAVPPVVRLTSLGIRSVPVEVVEAGQAFGATGWQLLFKVQMPVALPSIMAGINQTIMMALAMVVIASMIGAEGLGAAVLQGLARLQVGSAFVAGLGIVVLAMLIDRVTQGMVRAQPGGRG